MSKQIKTLIMTVAFLVMGTTNASAHGSFSNQKGIINDITYHMVNREKTFSIKYTGDKNALISNFNNIVKEAYSVDDYLSLSWSNIKPSVKAVSKGIEITLNVDYLSTKDQEKYVDSKIKSAISSIIRSNMSTYEKVKAINEYVLDKYSYDDTLKSRSVYDALTTSKTVCQGYAMTTYKLLKGAGINNRIVVGDTPFGYHSWNIVEIDGKWYNLDTTNNDSLESDKYFLVSDQKLIDNGYEWNGSAYPKATKDYDNTVVKNDPKLLSEAIKAVNSAKSYQTEYYINKAKEKVEKLVDSPEKTDLLSKIEAINKQLTDKLVATATNCVEYAEKYKSNKYINVAENAIEKLPSGEEKNSLVNRLDALKAPKPIEDNFLGLNSEKEYNIAKSATRDAEKYQTIYFINKAEKSIASLKECPAKTELLNKISDIYTALDAKKITTINSYLDKAVKYKKKMYLDIAVKQLSDINSTEQKRVLQNRINEISKLSLK